MKSIHHLLSLVLIGILLSACNDDMERLRDHGHETSATVQGKGTNGSRKPSSRSYTLDVAFFAQDTAEIAKDAHQHDALKDTTMSLSERLDNWHPGGGGLGTYMTTPMTVTQAAWERYKDGDRVQVVYLPEEPTVVRLKEEL